MKRDKTATIFTVLGATFLFCSFAFTNLDIIKLTGTAAHYKANAQAANIWFSIIGSTLGVYSGAVIINKGKVGVS